MNPVLTIALREYLAAVRTRSFWLGIAAVPLLAAVSLGLVALLQQAEPPVRYTIDDRSGWLDSLMTRETLSERARDLGEPPPAPDLLTGPDRAEAIALADAWLLSERRFERVRTAAQGSGATLPPSLFARLEVPAEPLADAEPMRLHVERRTRPEFEAWMRRTIHAALIRARLTDAGVAPETHAALLAAPPLEITVPGTGQERADRGLADMAPLAWVYALTLGIMAMTHRLLTSTVDERTSRLLDVMLSIVEPRTLLAGKLLGLAAVGLTLGAAWLVWPLGLSTLAPDSPGFGWIDAAFGPAAIMLFVSYFLLAYLLYGLWLAAFGAFCRDIRDANNLLAPVQVMLLAPLLLMLPIVRDPTGGLATGLTWLPPLTPFVMMNRLAAPPSTAEFVGTHLLLLASIAASWPVASRLFRRGLLTPVAAGAAPSGLTRWIRPRHDAAASE